MVLIEQMVKQMSSQNKLNYIGIEAPVYQTILLNEYLDTDENDFLDGFLYLTEGTPLASQQFVDIVHLVKTIIIKWKITFIFTV